MGVLCPGRTLIDNDLPLHTISSSPFQAHHFKLTSVGVVLGCTKVLKIVCLNRPLLVDQTMVIAAT